MESKIEVVAVKSRDGEWFAQVTAPGRIPGRIPGSDGTWMLVDLVGDQVDPYSLGEWTCYPTPPTRITRLLAVLRRCLETDILLPIDDIE